MNDDISFGKLVREHRLSLGLTQAELATRVGCATITIRKIEADAHRPSIQVSERLAMALDIPLEERADFVRLARTSGLKTPSPPPTPTPPPLPEEIGEEDLSGRAVRGFQLGERIGSGGFGAVYRAVQPGIEREVAIKIILPKYANHPEFIRRFEAEAHLVARLENPFIVPLYDYWREPDAAYLIMRLLRGGSLKDRLAEDPLDLKAILRLMDQIGGALHYAHRFGVIHRDLKPANILLDEARNGYLADFGIAKNLGNPDLEDQTGTGVWIGSPAYISPEQIRSEAVRPQADIYSLGLLLFELLTGTQAFRGPTPIDYLMQHLNHPLPSLADTHPDLPNQLDAVIRKATAKAPDERFRDVPAFLAEIQKAVVGRPDIDLELAAWEAALAEGDSQVENPFKGLRAFGEADAGHFFGREELIQNLLGHIGEEQDLSRFLAVIGPSGSGKSSVVKAGLVPALRRDGLPGSEAWFIVDMLPGTHPFEELEAALLRVAVNPPGSLLGQLVENERGLVRAVRRILPADERVELVLVIDQFEELFTLVEDEQTRALFLNSLVAAVMDDRSRLRVVVTMRADFTDRPLGYVDFGEMMQARSVFILPMTPDELERVITGPAEQVGLVLEPGLTARIIREVGSQPGSLPLLQYALTELFERREGSRLTQAVYAEIGGVLGALGRRAEEIYASLEQPTQAIARQMFLRLVTLGEGVEDTRRRVLRSEVAGLLGEGSKPDPQSHLQPATFNQVTDLFGKYRLLTFDRDPATREPTVEVAHEAILREWERLRGWLNDSRTDIRLQRQLNSAATEWQANHQDASYLLRGARLDQFEGWSQETELALTPYEQAFLTASLAERDREQAEEEARQAREVSLQKRSQRFLQALVGVFAIAVVIALFLTNFAFEQQDLAENEARIAVSRELAAASTTNLTVDVERSILLAIQSVLTTHNHDGTVLREAASSLHTAVNTSRLVITLPPALAVEYSPDGQFFVTSDNNGAIHYWDAHAIKELNSFESHDVPIQALAFDQSGQKLGVGGDDGNVSVWDVKTWEVVRMIETPSGVLDLVFNTDGTRIVTAGQAGVVIVWDITTGEALMNLAGHDTGGLDGVLTVKFSPNEEYIFTGSQDQTARIWDANTGKQLLWTLTTNWVTDIGFSQNADLFFLINGTGVGEVWDFPGIKTFLSNESLQEPIELPDSYKNFSFFGRQFMSAAFSKDGTRIATGNADGLWQVWDTATGQELLFQGAHLNSIQDIALIPDGSQIITTGDGATKIWDLTPSGSQEWLTIGGLSPLANFGTISPDGRIFAIGAPFLNEIQLWDIKARKILLKIEHEDGYPGPISFSPDGSLFTAGVFPSTTPSVWRLINQDGQIEVHKAFDLVGHEDATPFVAFNFDGTMIATSSFDKTIRIWDAMTGEKIRILSGHTDSGQGIAFSPDNSLLASTSMDGTAKIWDVSSGQELFTLRGHGGTGAESNNWVVWADFSPDGKKVATASFDGTVKIWDVATGQENMSIQGNSGGLQSVVYNSDGKLLLTAGQDGTAKLWDSETGAHLLTLTGHTNRILDARFSTDSRFITTVSEDGTARVYLLNIDELLDLAYTRVTRWFSPDECKQFLHSDTCPPPPWDE